MPHRARRTMLKAFWRIANPLAAPLAGLVPWWVLLETVGNRTGAVRRTPLASGPSDNVEMLLIAVHGRHSAWVRNLESHPQVRVRHRGKWRTARASVEPLQPQVVQRFNFYARSGPALMGIDPLLVRCRFD